MHARTHARTHARIHTHTHTHDTVHLFANTPNEVTVTGVWAGVNGAGGQMIENATCLGGQGGE